MQRRFWKHFSRLVQQYPCLKAHRMSLVDSINQAHFLSLCLYKIPTIPITGIKFMKQVLTREEWLLQAIEAVKPIFQEKGHIVPNVKVSCGFPSTGKDRHIGECWSKEISEGDINEIFISPKLDDPVEVLDTMIHELVHAVDNCKNSHGPLFKKIALSVGLEGKMRGAHASEKLLKRLGDIAKPLGPYPHKN